jgi:hypothetical protein
MIGDVPLTRAEIYNRWKQKDPARYAAIRAASRKRHAEKIATYNREYYAANLDEQRARGRAAYHANREVRLAQCVAFQKAVAADPVKRRRRNDAERNRRYKLSNAQYDAMVAQQGGLCAVCSQPPTMKGTLFVDHDHATGVIRGLLCGKCNTGIGMLGDSLDAIKRAARYLKRAGQTF